MNQSITNDEDEKSERKIDKENFIFFYFYDRKSFGKDSHRIVFINKNKFVTKVKTNFQVIFDGVKNVTMYFLRIQQNITRFMI